MTKRVKHIYEFGPFSLDSAEHALRRNGQLVPLRPKVFDILLALVQNHGHLVEKDQLMRLVWAEQFVEEGNLNKNVSMLRQALEEGRDGLTFIETVPKRGYRFVADVRVMNGEEPGEQRSETSEQISPVVSQTSASEVPVVTLDSQRKRFNTYHLAPVGLALLLVGALVYFAVLRNRRSSNTPRPTITSIAVLPLANLSGDPAEEYFVDGMTDALIGDLAKIEALRVISRTSAMHYKGTNKPLPEIARELNVDAVVEGTVQRSGDRVRVRAQLIHAASDSHLWAEDYDRDVRDLLDLQSEVARAIAQQVKIKITPSEQLLLTAKRNVNRQAYDDYLQGRFFRNKQTEKDLRLAIQHFESALRVDANYAEAFAGIADCYNQLGTVMIGALPPQQARQQAEIAAKKALQIDIDLAEAHAALGYVNHYNWNWALAEEQFKRAIQLNPNYSTARIHYAAYLVTRGRFDEAIAEANRAQEMDPLSLPISVSRGFVLENSRRYDEAIEQLRRVVAMDPNYYQAHWMLAHTYVATRRFDEGVVAAQKAVEISGRTAGALGVLGLAYGAAGRKGEAEKVLNELLQLNEQRYVTPGALVHTYVGLGNKDQTFVWLEKASQERSNYVAYLKVFPLMDPLRSDPRFRDLLRRTGLD